MPRRCSKSFTYKMGFTASRMRRGIALSDLQTLAFFLRGDFPAFVRIPVDLTKEADQNTHILLLESAAAEDAAEGEEDVLGILGIEIADLEQRCFHLVEQTLDILGGRTLNLLTGGSFERREKYFVKADRRRLRQIQRRVFGVGGNRDDPLAVSQILIR